MERYSVEISRRAQADIRDILRYIARRLREPATAERMLSRFEAAAASLEAMPHRFALVPDSYLASAGVRAASVDSYLIFYIVDQDAKTVSVSRVLYGRRNWAELLTQDLSQ